MSQLLVPLGQPFYFQSPVLQAYPLFLSAVGVFHLNRKLTSTQPEIRRGCNYFYKSPLILAAEIQSLSLFLSLLIKVVIAPLRLGWSSRASFPEALG